MPYLLTEEGVIVEDLDGVSWTDVIKQQRARTANESRLAAMYAALDAVEETPEELIEEATVPELKAAASELVKIEIGKENEALTASILDRMDQMSQREAERAERESQTQMALVAALHAIGTRNPVVNVEAAPAPNVTVEAAPPAEINVHVPEQPAPNVTVHAEVVPSQAETKKTVTFVRDFSGRIEGAEIAEE